MKRLLLLRHAQALPAESGSDIERALSPKGLSDAQAMGQLLKARNLVPGRIACSSAKRTQETCAEVLKGMESNVHTEFSKMIYSAHFGDLFQFIQNTDDGIESLMIIGHNPTVYELVVKLAARGDEAALNHLGQGYAPATLSVIETNIESWAEIDPRECALTAVFDPQDL